MKDLAGIVILGASVLLPVGVARAALALIVATLGGGPSKRERSDALAADPKPLPFGPRGHVNPRL